MRAPSPVDATLQTRALPRKHRFPLRSFGPGEASNMQQTVTSLWKLEDAAADDPASQTMFADGARGLLASVFRWEQTNHWRDGRPVELDPTWGYYLFLTDYDRVTEDNVKRAVKNLLEVQRRQLLGASGERANLFSKEAYHRLKLIVVEDQEALQDASVDRVRENFRALVRCLELQDDDSDGFPSPPPRNGVCLVLDAGKVEMMASLTFTDSDPKGNMRALEQCKLLAVDIHWKRPAMTRNEYRGCRELEIGMLDSVYSDLNILTLPDVEQ